MRQQRKKNGYKLQSPTDDQFGQFGSRLNGDTGLTGMNSALRRLHFEASTMEVAESKSIATAENVEFADCILSASLYDGF